LHASAHGVHIDRVCQACDACSLPLHAWLESLGLACTTICISLNIAAARSCDFKQ
jgi:hypothetical protein